MIRKLRTQKGFTLTEALVAVAILGLIGVALAAGIPTAVRVYRSVTQNAEANVLCATLTTAITDELRFAKNVETTAGGEVTGFDSGTFGRGVMFADSDGKIRIGGDELLSAKAYTLGLRAVLGALTYTDGCFHLELVIYPADSETPLAEAALVVRPLNGT